MNDQGFAAFIKDRTTGVLAKRTAWRRAMVALTFGLPLMCATPLAAQGCQPVLDAMNKIYTTPIHLYTTLIVQEAGEKKPYSYKFEQIYAGGVIYENSDGKWIRSTVARQQVMKAYEDNRRKGTAICRYLRDESVNGEMAAVYSMQGDRSDIGMKSDGQIWISKTKGLPLRDETDTDSRDHGKSQTSGRYEYANVRPPL